MKELNYKKSYINKGELNNIFIPTGKQWASTENDNLSVLESGKEGVLFKKIIKDINSAKEMICLQSFLIQDTEIIDALVKAKQERNVRIFVLNSAESRLGNSGFEEDESFATKDYKKMLEEKFKNNFIHRQAHNLHSKFILIDPKSNPKGYIFTGNFNQKPFFENPELAVELNKTQTKELFKVFVYHFWEQTTDEQTDTNQFDKVKPSGKFKKPKLKSVLITSPDTELSNLQSTLANVIENAKEQIIFSTFGFDINHNLSKSILNKLKSGIEVTVFCRPREKAIIENIDILAKNGAKVICHPLIHAKSILIDNNEAYIFTANFEKHGMDTGFESGVKLNAKQTKDLALILDKWKNSFPYTFETRKAIKDVKDYMDFNDTRKNKIIIPEKTETKSKVIKNVNELIGFINSISEPNHFTEKRYIFDVTVHFDEIKDFKTINQLKNGINLIEYDKVAKKKTITEKALLVDVNQLNINNEILEFLKKEYNNFKIFAK